MLYDKLVDDYNHSVSSHDLIRSNLLSSVLRKVDNKKNDGVVTSVLNAEISSLSVTLDSLRHNAGTELYEDTVRSIMLLKEYI